MTSHQHAAARAVAARVSDGVRPPRERRGSAGDRGAHDTEPHPARRDDARTRRLCGVRAAEGGSRLGHIPVIFIHRPRRCGRRGPRARARCRGVSRDRSTRRRCGGVARPSAVRKSFAEGIVMPVSSQSRDRAPVVLRWSSRPDQRADSDHRRPDRFGRSGFRSSMRAPAGLV